MKKWIKMIMSNVEMVMETWCSSGTERHQQPLKINLIPICVFMCNIYIICLH